MGAAVRLVIGPPGTGKTRHIARACAAAVRVGRRPLVCSLTRTAAREVAGRTDLPAEAVGTLHSHAYRSLGHPELVVRKISEWNESHPALALTDAGKDDLRGRQPPGDESHESYELLRHRQVPREQWPAGVQHFAALWEAWKDDCGLVDFTDLIEAALADVDAAPGWPDVIYADECQDHSALEYALLRKWGERAGAIVCVGDPWQALYTWRGAHPEAFDDPDVPDENRRTLSQSYRVPRRVHAAAVRWASRLSGFRAIEYEPRPEDGVVERCTGSSKHVGPLVDLAQKRIESGETVLVAASCGYMLAPLLAELKGSGIPYSNPWRNRGDWNPLAPIRGLSSADRLLALLAGPPWTYQQLADWTEVTKGVLNKGAKADLAQSADEAEPDAVVDELDLHGWVRHDELAHACDPDPRARAAWWESRLLARRLDGGRFPVRVLRRHGEPALRSKPRLYVGTIHSFKGAEADNVILMPDLSSLAMRHWVASGDGRDAVVRAMYVGMTRARLRLYITGASTAMYADIERAI